MLNPFEEIINRLSSIEKIVLELKDSHTTDKIQDCWMSVNELSAYLPGKPSLARIYNWTHRRMIPTHKMGKRLSFLKSEIDSWLTGNYQLTKKDLDIVTDIFIKANSTKRNKNG